MKAFVSRPNTQEVSMAIARKIYRSHNPSYLRFLRTSAERDADPGSVAVRANAKGGKGIDTSTIPNEALSPREGEHSHAIGALTISAVKSNGFKNCIEASR